MHRTIPMALAAIAVLLVAACGGGGGSSNDAVVGVLWQWNGLQETQPASLSAVPDPENYLLVLSDDGTFSAKADCNNMAGTYTLSGSDLTLEPGPMTLVACPPGSLSDKYVHLLAQVESQTVTDGQLSLGLKNGAGSMFFHVG